MKKILEKIEAFFGKLAEIGSDKWLHAIVCLFIGNISCQILQPMCYDAFLPPIIALFFTMGLGIAKEVYDSYKPDGTFDWEDLGFDLWGAGLGILLAIM